MKFSLALKGRRYADIVTIQEQLEPVGISQDQSTRHQQMHQTAQSLHLLHATTLKQK
jgi:hypothetical protein